MSPSHSAAARIAPHETQQSARLTSLRQAAEVALAQAPNRVQAVETEGGRAWVKPLRGDQQRGWHRIQRRAARLLRAPILAPTVSPGGQAALAEEARRLEALRQRGAIAPEVLDLGPRWLITSDLGPSLQEIWKSASSPQEQDALLRRAARALARLHAADGWHGRPALRDMVMTEHGIGFLDLEEDLENAMALRHRQARDLFLFMWSAAGLCRHRPEGLSGVLTSYDAIAPAEVWQPIRALSRPLGVLEFLLRPFAKKGGRDLEIASLATRVLRAYLAERGEKPTRRLRDSARPMIFALAQGAALAFFALEYLPGDSVSQDINEILMEAVDGDGLITPEQFDRTI